MRWGTRDLSLESVSEPSKHTLQPRQAELQAAEQLLTRSGDGYNVRPLPLLGLLAAALVGTWVALQGLTRDAPNTADATEQPEPSAVSDTPTIWVDLE